RGPCRRIAARARGGGSARRRPRGRSRIGCARPRGGWMLRASPVRVRRRPDGARRRGRGPTGTAGGPNRGRNRGASAGDHLYVEEPVAGPECVRLGLADFDQLSLSYHPEHELGEVPGGSPDLRLLHPTFGYREALVGGEEIL